jgi:glycosyltransferase involved in cell wall biosynthesis
MKILRIIARLNIGGPARNAVLLSEGLKDKGFDTVLVCGEVTDNEGDMMYLAQEKDISPVVIRELGREISWKDDLAAFWKIYKIICREKPDIVHTHTAKAGTLGRLAALFYNLTHFKRHSAKRKAHSVILVHTFHGHVFKGYFGRLKTLFFVWIERFLALFTDKIVTVSGTLKKELVEKYRIAPEEKVVVIELGFKLDDLFKLPLREGSGIVNIGIVGRLASIKNHKMLFRVAERIAHSAKQKVKFFVIGGGELRRELEDYVKALDIEDIVEFRGWIKDLCEIYRSLDIVVLTSLNEGTPVSIIEAMAASRPIVATNVGGVSDVVEEQKSGYLSTINDEAFAERTLDLIKDRKRRQAFGEYGREIVRGRFSKCRLIKDTEDLYTNLLR